MGRKAVFLPISVGLAVLIILAAGCGLGGKSYSGISGEPAGITGNDPERPADQPDDTGAGGNEKGNPGGEAADSNQAGGLVLNELEQEIDSFLGVVNQLESVEEDELEF